MNTYTALIGQATSGQTLIKHTKWLILFTLLSLLSACGSGNEEGADLDSQAPIISLNGDADINVIIGDDYQDLGAVAQDNIDGNITITTVGQVDTSTVGSYIITYTATDSADNSIFISRTVNVLELDVTLPQISLIGLSPLSIDEGGFYIEYGASAQDERDGVLDVAISGTVNSNVPGSYSVTYTAQDTAGNRASLVRTVEVSDLTPPVITLNGAAQISMREDTNYSELGAIAVDTVNGSVNVEISSSINTATPGSYLVNYSAVDSAGNRANVTRTVNVIDVTAPVITLNGQRVLMQNEDTAYTEAGAIAIDNLDVTVDVVISGTLDPTSPGTYTLTYTATDIAGNTAATTRSITFSDITPPVIMLAGASNITASFSSPYIDAGATAIDNSGETISVSVTGTVDTSKIGSYGLTYTATDSANNKSAVTRTVNVLDMTPPVITLKGDNPVIQDEDITYTEAGADAQDDLDGTVDVIISGALDHTTPGTYILTYTATDAAGNEASRTRIITVSDTTAPVITLAGENPYTQNDDTTYIEPGYRATDNSGETITVIVSGAVNASIPGSYTLTYTATDSADNTSATMRTINVKDITSPVIALLGAENINVPFNIPYEDAGAVAIDNSGEIITVNVRGAVNTSIMGRYELTYTAIDSTGNESTAIRIVNVLDMTPPVINLNGSNAITIIKGRGYSDPVTAIDNVDGMVSVTITGNIDVNIIGTYTQNYTAIDVAGNRATASRTVIVREFLAFKTTWKTDNEGRGKGNEITIRTATNNQNYTVDWGDGRQNTGVTGSISHAYSRVGIYTVSITGDFKNIQCNETSVADDKKLISIEQWGEGQWSTMHQAFYGCEDLILNATDIPDLSQVTDMSRMFAGTAISDGDISRWDVSQVTNMSEMFSDAKAFNGDISLWDVSQVTDMSGMFSGATVFNGDISLWVVSQVMDMSEMFSGAKAFNGDISRWVVSQVTDMSEMFYGAYAFNGDISRWIVSQVTDMSSMFNSAKAFNGDISLWVVSQVTDMSSMFNSAFAFNGDISLWVVSKVTTMASMFDGTAFNGDIRLWDVSSVTDMSRTFNNASFDRDISEWVVSSVTDMSAMFAGGNFNGDISRWDVSNVTDMSGMFAFATTFNGDISQWVVSSVTDMTVMFWLASAFNGDISRWDVSQVTSTYGMFWWADAFNGDISEWRVHHVTTMSGMFFEAIAFNGDISQWVVSQVTNMDSMFFGAEAFNGGIGEWDVSQVTKMDNMLSGVTLSTANYDALLQGWSSQTLQPSVKFDGGNSQYSAAAQTARDSLLNTYGWTVTDGGLLVAQ